MQIKMKKRFFQQKEIKHHPAHTLGNDVISRKIEHTHLGIILEDKLNLQSYIKEVAVKARRGIGLIKCLYRYGNREVLIEFINSVRSHVDYGDIVHHKPDPEMRHGSNKKLQCV